MLPVPGAARCCPCPGAAPVLVLPVPCLLSFAGCSAALQPFLWCILLLAFHSQINFISGLQALPGTASGLSIGLRGASTSEKQMESINSQIKLHCCYRYAQSGREGGNFYNLPADINGVEFSLVAT